MTVAENFRIYDVLVINMKDFKCFKMMEEVNVFQFPYDNVNNNVKLHFHLKIHPQIVNTYIRNTYIIYFCVCHVHHT